MRRLPCYSAGQSTVSASFARASSQDGVRNLTKRRQHEHSGQAIVRHRPAAQVVTSNRRLQCGAPTRTSKSNQSSSGQVDTLSGRERSIFMTKLAPRLSTLSSLHTGRPEVLLTQSHSLVKSKYYHLASSSIKGPSRSFASLNSSPNLGQKSLGISSTPMSSNARDSDKNINKFEPREISFKTSYGHVACLEWGQRDAPNKILCVHGWLDNAGSFEPIAPFILRHKDNLTKYHLVALDLPGVGHSSHRPAGAEYTTFSNIIEMRRVTQHLGWNQNLILMAHSLGGHLSFLYSCIYPKQVSSLISIDTTHPLTHQPANWYINIGNSIEHYFKCENHNSGNSASDTVVPLYTEEDAIKRLTDAHSNSLTLESAKVMFKRGATKHPNGGCTFNRDVRHRHLSVEFRPDDELMLKFLEHTFKPENLLVIRALRSPYHRPKEQRLRYYSLFEKNCNFFRDIMLDGTHHLHMNTPELVADEINRFLDDAELAREKAALDCDSAPFVGKPKF